MKLKEARKIGAKCDLETDAECVNNISIHALNLFAYGEIGPELLELKTDAKASRVKFSIDPGCRHVIEPDRSIHPPCPLCQSFRKIKEV